jgi:hypothetical protein
MNMFGKKNFVGCFSPPFAVINDLENPRGRVFILDNQENPRGRVFIFHIIRNQSLLFGFSFTRLRRGFARMGGDECEKSKD